MLTRYACTVAELSCVIGNIFAELSPPCAACGAEVLQITGTTVTGNAATLTVTEAGFDFDGCADDTAIIERMRKGRCIYAKTGAGAERTEGTHYGLDRLQEFMRRFYRKNGIDGWILKGDISKYFYSIRHDVLKTLIREKITDPDVLRLVDLIIDSTEGNVGIPIGNQTSQLFALLYLDGLDHFVKEKLGIKYYGRYMDDFFLIHHDKAYLQECRKQIEAFVQARGLSLNAKTNIFPLKHGVDFLGFHTYLTESGAVIRKVRRRSKNNMKRKLKKLAALHAAGRIDAKTVEQSYQSWRGHAEKGNSYHLIRRTDHYYNSLMKPKEAAQCQKH